MIADQSLKVTIETKKKLEELKLIPQDTMDNVIQRLLDIRDTAVEMGMKLIDVKTDNDHEEILRQISDVVKNKILK